MSRTDDEALTLTCDHCLQPPGKRCVYTNEAPGSGHKLGDETKVPHAARRHAAKIRLARKDGQSARQERNQDKARIEALTLGIRRLEIILGCPEPLVPDPGNPEHTTLRSWLAAHGNILLGGPEMSDRDGRTEP